VVAQDDHVKVRVDRLTTLRPVLEHAVNLTKRGVELVALRTEPVAHRVELRVIDERKVTAIFVQRSGRDLQSLRV
jgi:hypothetical protein